MLVISGEPVPPAAALVWAATGGFIGALGLGTFYLALSRGTMGLVAPLTALIAATIPALIGLARGEDTGPLTLLGMGAALAAVVFISLPDERLGRPKLAAYRGSRALEWLLIALSGLSFAAFFLFIDRAHGDGAEVWWPLLMIKLGGVAAAVVIVMVLAPLGRASLVRIGRAGWLMGTVAGTADLGGNLLFIMATGEGTLAVVVVLSSLYPVITAILARILLHERLGPVRLFGVACAVAGVMLIGVGAL